MNQRTILSLLRFGLLAGLAIVVGLFVRNYTIYRIPDSDQSLAPAFPAGSRLLVEDLGPDDAVARGMEVVYEQVKEGTRYARYGRVAAIPGDVVGEEKGRLMVNGVPTLLRGPAAGVVPPGKVYLLAGNPMESTYPDSRVLGFVDRKAIRGVIRTRFAWSR